MMTIRKLATALAIPALPLVVIAQGQPVAYHDLSTMPRWPLGNMQVNGVMGQTGSFGVGEMPSGKPGPAGNAHYHSQEQIVFGLKGSPVLLMSGVPYRLGSYGAVVTPANAEHSGINGATAGPATFIEFQPVLRSDWFPPHFPFKLVKSEMPVPVSRDQHVFENFDPSSDGWRSNHAGLRSKVLSGKTIRVTVFELSNESATATLDHQGSRPEQFVYVLEGQAQLAVDAGRREIAAQTLAVIAPSAKDIRLQSAGKGRALVAVFDSIAR